MKRYVVSAEASPSAGQSSSNSNGVGDSDGDRSSVMAAMMQMPSVLACATMRLLGQADYAAVSRCSRYWRRVSLRPEATPYAVRFGGCWRDVSFGALGHLRPHRLDVAPELSGRVCASVAPRDDVEHKRCDWRRVLPLLQSPGVYESVCALRLSLSAHESPETVAEFVTAVAAMTHLTGFQLYMNVLGGVPQRAHGATVASLIGARAASLVRLGISGASFAIGDTDATIAALGGCTSLRHLMLQMRADWMIGAPVWTRISRAIPAVTTLRLLGLNAHTLQGFAAAVRGAVDAEYDPIPVDGVDGRHETASPTIERAFMQLESLDIQASSDASAISFAPMPNLARLKVTGGRRQVPAPESAPLPPLTTTTTTTVSPAVTTEAPPSPPPPPALVYQISIIALDDRDYCRVVPSAYNRTANLINDVPASDDPKRASKTWSSLRELELDAISFIGNELNRLPALKVLTLGSHVQVSHAFAWSLSQASQLHRRAVYLGRTVEEQQQIEKKSRSSSSSSGAADSDAITTTDEPAQPYRLTAIVVATAEIVDAIRRLGVQDAWRLVRK